MLAILNTLNAHNLPIFQPILMILVSKFVVHRALSNKKYLFPFKLHMYCYIRYPRLNRCSLLPCICFFILYSCLAEMIEYKERLKLRVILH